MRYMIKITDENGRFTYIQIQNNRWDQGSNPAIGPAGRVGRTGAGSIDTYRGQMFFTEGRDSILTILLEPRSIRVGAIGDGQYTGVPGVLRPGRITWRVVEAW